MGVHTGDSSHGRAAQTLTDRSTSGYATPPSASSARSGSRPAAPTSSSECTRAPADGGHRDEPARVALLGARVEGDQVPIAKIAAKLAVGYTLDELKNRHHPLHAGVGRAHRLVVTKIPRFAFEKFRGERHALTQMKSVGEAVAIQAHVPGEPAEGDPRAVESIAAASSRRSASAPATCSTDEVERIKAEVRVPRDRRIFWVAEELRAGLTVDGLRDHAHRSPGSCAKLEQDRPTPRRRSRRGSRGTPGLRAVKRMGFSDKRIARLAGTTEKAVRALEGGVRPVFKRVDTCAAEFEAYTPYLYSTYEEECKAAPTDRRKVMILGSGGPGRTSGRIEFDYCCVHASFALSRAGFETIMVNCNPETVSTGYDTSDRLYFEPLARGRARDRARREAGGAHRPVRRADAAQARRAAPRARRADLRHAGRDRPGGGPRALLGAHRVGLRQPENGMARSAEEAFAIARRIGYPVMVRPSYVLGGRAMEVVYDDKGLETYLQEAVQASNERPVLVDRFLRDAAEVDVDVVSDGTDVVVGGVMEHIEEAGIHSGDSACALRRSASRRSG